MSLSILLFGCNELESNTSNVSETITVDTVAVGSSSSTSNSAKRPYHPNIGIKSKKVTEKYPDYTVFLRSPIDIIDKRIVTDEDFKETLIITVENIWNKTITTIQTSHKNNSNVTISKIHKLKLKPKQKAKLRISVVDPGAYITIYVSKIRFSDGGVYDELHPPNYDYTGMVW